MNYERSLIILVYQNSTIMRPQRGRYGIFMIIVVILFLLNLISTDVRVAKPPEPS